MTPQCWRYVPKISPRKQLARELWVSPAQGDCRLGGLMGCGLRKGRRVPFKIKYKLLPLIINGFVRRCNEVMEAILCGRKVLKYFSVLVLYVMLLSFRSVCQ